MAAPQTPRAAVWALARQSKLWSGRAEAPHGKAGAVNTSARAKAQASGKNVQRSKGKGGATPTASWRLGGRGATPWGRPQQARHVCRRWEGARVQAPERYGGGRRTANSAGPPAPKGRAPVRPRSAAALL